LEKTQDIRQIKTGMNLVDGRRKNRVVSTHRDEILSRIEHSLRGIDEKRDHAQGGGTASLPEWVPDDAPWEEVKKEIEALSDRFYTAEHPGDMHRILKHVVLEHAVTLAVRWEHPLLERLGIDGILGDMGVEVRVPSREEEWKALSAKARLGITTAEALVMESGTLVLRADAALGRSTSLLPPVHLAVVQSDHRLKELHALPLLFRSWAKEPQGLPSAVTLVTGHSCTADIELTLVSGVHGPGLVYVIGLSSGYDADNGAASGPEPPA
jgi:L-lactate dehydrogenase complex protein LldG